MGTTVREKISREDLLAKNQIIITGKASDFANNSFRYYTRKSTLQKIKTGKFLFVSSFANMNDLEEAEMHAEEKHSVFALCFCNTGSEGIPMWYMYSGVFGDGACLNFTPSLMIRLLKSIETVYEVDKNGKLTDKALEIGKDISLQYGWVYYKDEKNDIYYRNQWYHIEDDQEGFFRQNYFVKTYPWAYEREFRIVFIAQNGVKPHKIALPIPDEILEQIKVTRGPESDEPDPEKRCRLRINMNLYLRNEDEILAYQEKKAHKKT